VLVLEIIATGPGVGSIARRDYSRYLTDVMVRQHLHVQPEHEAAGQTDPAIVALYGDTRYMPRVPWCMSLTNESDSGRMSVSV